MADKTQGDLLKEYMVAANPTDKERGARPESLQGLNKVILSELAARVGTSTDKVHDWRDDKKAMGPAHVDAVADELGIHDMDKPTLGAAAARLKTKLSSAAEATETTAPAPAAGDPNDAIRAAGKALRDLMALTPKSAAELKTRRSTVGAAGSAGVDHVLAPELAARTKKSVNLKPRDIKQRVGRSDHTPVARITPKEAAAIITALATSVPGEDRPEFDAAAARFKDAVRASQPAWDAAKQSHADKLADRTARMAERKHNR